ncbi:SCO5717 family growth-regulating ATPase, partial [Streptomyces spiramenti]|uniref:SCO5717 family growth-regulating ATPase n=1 Tax=Streptomyces spiramenti TaxID=2720606 RepID=UPI003B8350C8
MNSDRDGMRTAWEAGDDRPEVDPQGDEPEETGQFTVDFEPPSWYGPGSTSQADAGAGTGRGGAHGAADEASAPPPHLPAPRRGTTAAPGETRDGEDSSGRTHPAAVESPATMQFSKAALRRALHERPTEAPPTPAAPAPGGLPPLPPDFQLEPPLGAPRTAAPHSGGSPGAPPTPPGFMLPESLSDAVAEESARPGAGGPATSAADGKAADGTTAETTDQDEDSYELPAAAPVAPVAPVGAPATTGTEQARAEVKEEGGPARPGPDDGVGTPVEPPAAAPNALPAKAEPRAEPTPPALPSGPGVLQGSAGVPQAPPPSPYAPGPRPGAGGGPSGPFPPGFSRPAGAAGPQQGWQNTGRPGESAARAASPYSPPPSPQGPGAHPGGPPSRAWGGPPRDQGGGAEQRPTPGGVGG